MSGPCRYALDADGVLHPWPGVGIRPVAAVVVRARLVAAPCREPMSRDEAIVTAYRDGENVGDIAKAHRITTERVRQICRAAGCTMRPRGGNAKIALSPALSAMDRRAAASEAVRVASVAPAPRIFDETTAMCRCGGTGANSKGPVPAWFGRDCIETDCPLRRPVKSRSRG